MDELVIIPCGSLKATGDKPIPAHKMYKGNFFITHKNYANHFYNDWYILSAKYGIIHKDTLITPYNISFKSNEAVSVDVIKDQLDKLKPQNIIAITSLFYHNTLKAAYDGSIYNPFSDHFTPFLNNGNQQKFLKLCIKHNLTTKELINAGISVKHPPASNEFVRWYIRNEWPVAEMVSRAEFRKIFSCSNLRYKMNYNFIKWENGLIDESSFVNYFNKSIPIANDVKLEKKIMDLYNNS